MTALNSRQQAKYQSLLGSGDAAGAELYRSSRLESNARKSRRPLIAQEENPITPLGAGRIAAPGTTINGEQSLHTSPPPPTTDPNYTPGPVSSGSVTSPPITVGGTGLVSTTTEDRADVEKDAPLVGYDPNKPVFALEDTLHKATVQGQLAGLEAHDSDYLARHRASAVQQAQSRGLMNTTMAAQAGEAAALDAAFNIASQDAGLYADLLKQDIGYQQQRGLNTQQFDLQTQLNTQLHGFDTQTRELVQRHALELEDVRNSFAIELDKLNYSQELEGALLSMSGDLIGQGVTALTQLATSPDATEKEYNAIKQTIINGLTTFSNIWKVPSGSKDIFDFSGIA